MTARTVPTVIRLAALLALSSAGCRRATAQGVGGDDGAALAAICAPGRQGDVRVVQPLPAGVTEPTARGMQVGWRRAAAVRVAVAAPERRGSRLVLRAVVENTATTPQEVFLEEAGTGYFHATLTGEGLLRRTVAAPPLPPGVTAPPALFPMAHGYVLAPGVRWTHVVEVELGCWSLEGTATVNVHWWFSVAGEAMQGDLTARLRGGS